jgi:6-pyruvoyltetrahydropterin/6-carboxytetrahydropterin synthase
MPQVYVTRRAHFNAAHRLHNPSRSNEWNRETFGKCNAPNWHGHNYVLEVTVVGSPDPDTGYVIDLGDLQTIVQDQIISSCDHANLNLDVDFLKDVIPSAENLAMAFWNRLVDRMPGGSLYQIRLFETERNFVEYRGEESR